MAGTMGGVLGRAWEWAVAQPVLGAVLSAPAHYPLEHVLQSPLDARRWDWAQLQILNAHAFRWDYGSTPFTNWQVIAAAWATYAAVILGIRVSTARARARRRGGSERASGGVG